MLARPGADEAEGYLWTYIDRVPDGPVADLLVTQGRETAALLDALPREAGARRYAPGKWSLAQVVAHMADTERVFAFRMLWALRGDDEPLPGFEQDAWTAAAGTQARPLDAVTEDLRAVRAATATLVRGAHDEAWLRRVRLPAGGISARALAYVIAGHELHHRAVLAERYLTAGDGRGLSGRSQ